MSATNTVTQQRNIHLGLGEAIRRLIRVEMMYARGLTADKTLLEESHLITDALNQQYQLDLGFDCNDDGIPDTIEIFTKSAETACCRLVPDGPRAASKVRTSSRESLMEELAPKRKKKAESATTSPAPKLEVVETPVVEAVNTTVEAVVEEPTKKKTSPKKDEKKKDDKKSKSFLSRLMGDE